MNSPHVWRAGSSCGGVVSADAQGQFVVGDVDGEPLEIILQLLRPLRSVLGPVVRREHHVIDALVGGARRNMSRPMATPGRA